MGSKKNHQKQTENQKKPDKIGEKAKSPFSLKREKLFKEYTLAIYTYP